MPYKNPEDKIANRRKNYPRTRDKDRMESLFRLREVGLEPVDINDPYSNVFCETCGKETPRAVRYSTRHEEDCYFYAESLSARMNANA